MLRHLNNRLYEIHDELFIIEQQFDDISDVFSKCLCPSNDCAFCVDVQKRADDAIERMFTLKEEHIFVNTVVNVKLIQYQPAQLLLKAPMPKDESIICFSFSLYEGECLDLTNFCSSTNNSRSTWCAYPFFFSRIHFSSLSGIRGSVLVLKIVCSLYNRSARRP